MKVTEQKQKIRREMMEWAAQMDRDYCHRADLAIVKYIMELPEYQEAERIFCFVGRETEIDTAPVIEDALKRGKTVCVPRCAGKGIMDACRIQGFFDLKPGHYGILEPGEEAEALLPGEIDFAVTPCLSCSSRGIRLGYGGGYYDRYLAETQAFKAAVCRERMIREDIPVDSHDVGMDAVVSETGVRRIYKSVSFLNRQ